jgi:crotonobetainyl-CoA:carnitine CoA-transferase CaiB-like acyl-CoA transferase
MAYMETWCAARSREAILDAFARYRIPAGPVLSLQEALDHPQTMALGLHEEVTFPGLPRPARIARAPVALSGHQTAMRPPPLLGADTKDILVSLGFTGKEIAGFEAEQAI